MSCLVPDVSLERLVIVSRSIPPDTGGYQRQISLLAPHLAEQFAAVDWIGVVRDDPLPLAPSVPGIDRMVRVPGHLLPRRIRGLADLVVVIGAVSMLVTRRVRRQRVRLLLLSPTMAGAPTLTRLAGWLGARIVARYATSGDQTVRRGRRVGMQSSVRAIVPSPLQLQEQDGFPVTLVVNAVGLPDEADRFRRTGEHRFLYVGRLVARKRVDVLVAAWMSTRRHLEGWALDIVGDGGSETDSVEADIARLVAEGGDCGVRLRGRIPDARRVMSEADVFVFPSEREGMPNSLLEALAAGLPVIADSTQAADWFVNVPPLVAWDGTQEGLALVLRDTARDEALRRHLGDRGRAFVAAHHAPDASARAIADL